jgi:hypothetical protein
MSNAILFRMNYGIPGELSRPSQATVEPQAFNSSVPFNQYGIPGKMVAGLFVPLSLVGDTAPYGFLVRPYPITGLNASDPLATGVPICTGGFAANVMRRGYMTVFCQAGSPVIGGAIYVRYANPAGAAVLGGVEAALIGGTTVALTNCAFMSGIDPSGNAEIQFNI